MAKPGYQHKQMERVRNRERKRVEKHDKARAKAIGRLLKPTKRRRSRRKNTGCGCLSVLCLPLLMLRK